jgi:hypothetical protein
MKRLISKVSPGHKPEYYVMYSSVLKEQGECSAFDFLDTLKLKGSEWEKWFRYVDLTLDATRDQHPANVFMRYLEAA